jgi:hypothetical protein
MTDNEECFEEIENRWRQAMDYLVERTLADYENKDKEKVIEKIQRLEKYLDSDEYKPKDYSKIKKIKNEMGLEDLCSSKKPRKSSGPVKISPKTLAGVVYGAIGAITIGMIALGIYTRGHKDPQPHQSSTIEDRLSVIPKPNQPEVIVVPADPPKAEERIMETPEPPAREERVITAGEQMNRFLWLKNYYVKPVNEGNTLHEIVEKNIMGVKCEDEFARCKELYTQVAQLNKVSDPNKLVNGQLILLPKNIVKYNDGLSEGQRLFQKWPEKYFVMTKGQTLDDLSNTLMGRHDDKFIHDVVKYNSELGFELSGNYVVPYGERIVFISRDTEVVYSNKLIKHNLAES